MKEVVNEILAAEKKAERLLTEARQQSAQIRQESEKEASVIISDAQKEAQKLLQTTVTAARSEAEQSREKSFAAFREEQEDLLHRNQSTVNTLIDDIVALITTSSSQAPGNRQ